MHFNYRKEKAEFLAEWKKEEKLLRSQNVSDDIIKQIYEFSFNQFKSERNYYINKEEFSSEDDLGVNIDFEENLDIFDNIENDNLLKALRSLRDKDMELVMMVIKGHTETEVAEKLGQSQPNISKKIARIKKYLKKFL